MSDRFQPFWNQLFRHDITDKQQLLREAVRVRLTRHYIENSDLPLDDIEHDRDRLFKVAKRTEEKLGYFPGDRELFLQLYQAGKNLDLLDFTVETYKNSRTGLMFSSSYVTEQFFGFVKQEQPETLLIAEAEKFINGLRKLVEAPINANITLLTLDKLFFELLKLVFHNNPHIQVIQASIYRKLDFPDGYDMILAVPDFAGKLENREDFIAPDTTGAAVENLLKNTNEGGALYVCVPSKFTFAEGDLRRLRTWIEDHYGLQFLYALPEGAFRPYTAIKTYLVGIRNHPLSRTQIGNLDLENNKLIPKNEKTIKTENITQAKDWRIELQLSEYHSQLQQYQASKVPKIKLKEAAEAIFRGKSVMKKDIRPGEIFVLNISNMEDGEVRTDNMDTIDEEERKIKRYELLEGDLVMTCRGTVNKIAVVRDLTGPTIASANIIVVRLKEHMVSDYVKIFLESPIGQTLIKSFQRGTTVMNINPKDIAEIEIPVVDFDRQRKMAEAYRSEFQFYKETIQNATNRWKHKQNELYSELLEEGDQWHGSDKKWG